MKILNLYAGIGGNRKLWDSLGKFEITAVEWDEKIAKIYSNFFPSDKVIVADAHEYLLEHFKEYDFIWSSPPCPTHSMFNNLSAVQEGKSVKYPDMTLYQEIIYLRHWFKGRWCVENVISYYDPLIPPQNINNHYFWTNFPISILRKNKRGVRNEKDHVKIRAKQLGFDLDKLFGNSGFLSRILNNCVEPELGKHILNCALNKVSLF
mgnify:CR=1 FL=1